MASTFLSDLTQAGLAGWSLQATIVANTTTNGTGVDTQLGEGPVHAVYSIATLTDATLVVTVKLQESDDNSTNWTDVVAPPGVASVTLAAPVSSNIVGFVSPAMRTKRYVRAVVITASGGAVSVPIAVIVLGRKEITGTGTGYKS